MRRKSEFAVLAALMSVYGTPARAEPIRVGWQTPWAVQGQLVMGLMKTDIGSANGLQLSFSGFQYGGPLNQAAISGNVDIVLTADQPALVLLERSQDFVILGRMMYNRVCIYSAPAGPVQKLSDLAGKSGEAPKSIQVFGPTGAAAERVALGKLAAAGVDFRTIKFGSLDMARQAALLKSTGADAKEWRGVDVLYGFDPLVAVFEETKLARMLDCDKVVAVVLAHKSLTENRPRDAERFMCSFVASWYQFAAKPKEMNASFISESGLNASDWALDLSASLEPNRWAKTREEFRFDFVSADFEIMEAANAFLVTRGALAKPVDVQQRIDLRPLRAALASPSCRSTLDAVPYPVRK